MMDNLRKVQQNLGAMLAHNNLYPETFGNDDHIFQQINTGTFLYDQSHWGLIELSGQDKIRYLHNQSTNDINKLKSGEGCETVFVTSTARTIDLANVYITEDRILLLVSSECKSYLMEWLDRFIFPMDKVELRDLSSQYAIFNIFGSSSEEIIENLGFNHVVNLPEYAHQVGNFEDTEIRVIVGTSLKIKGYTLFIPVEKAENFWLKLMEMNLIPVGEKVWQSLRILQGRPLSDHELTEDYNPLEAGLWHTISFNKGCYIGQETIARLNTYKGVKQRLWGIKLNQMIPPNSIITLNGEKIGTLTSITQTPSGIFGLAYIKTKAGGEGLNVQIENAQGEIMNVPYLIHQYYEPKEV